MHFFNANRHCMEILTITGVSGKLITFSEEPTIHDVHFMDGRLSTYPRCGNIGRCATECYSEPSCVSFGYAATTTTSCQLYDFGVANFTVNVIQQSNTVYYKGMDNNVFLNMVRYVFHLLTKRCGSDATTDVDDVIQKVFICSCITSVVKE